MVEPTENENKDKIDKYVAAVAEEMGKAKADPDYAHHAPTNTSVGRIDSGWSVRNLVVSYKIMKDKREKGEFVP